MKRPRPLTVAIVRRAAIAKGLVPGDVRGLLRAVAFLRRWEDRPESRTGRR